MTDVRWKIWGNNKGKHNELHLATWNVLSFFRTAALSQLNCELQKYSTAVAAIQKI
jgi:hypothetical protein